jgi:hypothetical protein
MSRLALRRVLSTSRGRVVVVVATLALVGAVVAHHSVPTDMHDMSAGVMCIAVVGAALGVATVIGPLALPPVRSSPQAWRPSWTWIGAPRSAPVRAGPLFLRLQVLRR